MYENNVYEFIYEFVYEFVFVYVYEFIIILYMNFEYEF